MIRYTLNDREFMFSYKELREKYIEFCSMNDDDFRSNLPAALHLACFICWVKELKTSDVLSDVGIIHELAHLIHFGEDGQMKLEDIRKLFKQRLELA